MGQGFGDLLGILLSGGLTGNNNRTGLYIGRIYVGPSIFLFKEIGQSNDIDGFIIE